MAAGHRRLRILALLVGTERQLETKRLCEVCADVTGMTGAGVMLMSGDVPRGSVCTSNRVSRVLEKLQDDLGEGPCVDAYRLDRPVFEPDLADPHVVRWPAFTGPATEAGAQAVFGFPMPIGAMRLGALNLYRDSAGPLTDDQHADALVMADVAAQAILVLQADAPAGEVAPALEASADFQYTVHQAAGMVAVQLDITVGQALVRLRAHAFGNGLTLAEVAAAVVTRTVRFDAGDDEQYAAP